MEDNLYSPNCVVFHWGLSFSVYRGMPWNREVFLYVSPITSIIKQCSILAQSYAYYNSNCFHMIIFRVFPYVVRYLSCM